MTQAATCVAEHGAPTAVAAESAVARWLAARGVTGEPAMLPDGRAYVVVGATDGALVRAGRDLALLAPFAK